MPQRRHNERPLKRTNPSGKTVWVARYTNRAGKRVSAGTFELKRDAQDAIDAAYEAPDQTRTLVKGYAADWTRRHPRTEETDRTYRHRIASVLPIKIVGVPFGDWEMADVTPREGVDIVDHLLRVDGRAASGAQAVVKTLQAMWSDAARDGVVPSNPWREITVRSNDRRVQKPKRETRLYTREQMHAVADAASGVYSTAMIRTLSDCGLRLGEMLPLERAQLHSGACGALDCKAGAVPHLHVAGKTGARVAPVPPSLLALLQGLPPRLDTRLLFPAPRGGVWDRSAFYRRVWRPACKDAGLVGARPHEFRHAWVSRMRAAGIDVADVAAAAGHSVQTASTVYTHALERSYGAMAEAAEA